MGRTSFFLVLETLIRHLASVIIRNFDIVSITFNEPEADPPLIVDRDRVLSFPVSPELVESIAQRNPKVIQTRRQVDVLQLSPCPTQYI